MKEYRCKICGYLYKKEKGDPVNGIKSNTDFDDIPQDWVCPVCGAFKKDFKEINSNI